MRLCDTDIERHLDEGKIVIEPRPGVERISGVSVDVLLKTTAANAPAPTSLIPLRCNARLLANQASVIMMCTLKPFLAVGCEHPSRRTTWPPINDPETSSAWNRLWAPRHRWPC